jgi:lipopolysaccharide biosynthesis glycosyltransferase
MNLKEKIAVVVACDNQYAVLTAALIKSIEINHRSNELLSFTIIDDGISNVNKERLQNSIRPDSSSIHFIKSSKVIPPEIKIPVDDSTYPITAYLRLFAPYAVGLDCKKIIYMDVDMLMYDDISNLYHIDIGDNIVGAVQDYQGVVSSPYAIKNYKALGIPPETKYFNSGLLVINSKKWIEADIANKVIKCMIDNKGHYDYPDQYGFNVVLLDQWHEISLLWNCSDYFEIPSNPSLVHFLNIKPIFKSCTSLQRHKDEFYRVLNLTEFKGFMPKNDYHRLFKKGFTKAKKIILNTFNTN